MSLEESISTHAPLAGRDPDCGSRPRRGVNFNPRAPCGARLRNCINSFACSYFNPRAPCGARRVLADGLVAAVGISTHAPLAGRDALNNDIFQLLVVFQPTRPLRGAT